MDAYAKHVADYLLAQGWQIALLAVVVGLISFTLRNRSAHIRYLLWLIVLAKCIVPPVYSVPVPVLPERPLIERLPRPATPEIQVVDLAVKVPAPIDIEVAVKPQESERALPGTKETAVLVWSLGAFLFLVWVGVRAIRYTLWLRSRRSPLPDHLRQILQESLKGLKLKKLPRIWLTQDIGQPFVWGLLRGSVYLPVDFLDLDGPERCRTILVHELSHVARFDAAINVLQVMAQAIYWFHPFVWWMNRRIRQEREKCCDEVAVVRLNAPPEHYTGAIVEALAAERRSAHSIPSLAIVGSVKDIEERIRTMLRPGKKFCKHPSLPAVAIVVLTALFAVPTTLVLTARANAALIFGNPTNLGPMVNSSTRSYEWDPHISPDGLELYFLLEWERPDGSWCDDIWLTTRKAKDKPWGPPVNLGPLVNTGAFEGAPCLSAEGLELYFVSDRPGGSGSTDILVTKRKTKDSLWGPPVNLGPKVNSTAAENGPSISADGLELYFSDAIWSSPPPRPGGMGGADIWVTKRESKNRPWGPPVNLGPTINSSAGDVAPSISTDGLSLYFVSKRPGGFGDMDIWVTTRKTKNSPWDTPLNLGPTVNSSGIENNPDISSDGSTLYFVSGRPGNVGGDGYVDIWQVSLKAETKPAKSLERAAIYGDIDQVRLNLSLGADVNAKGMHGRTALHYAASKGYIEIAKVLIAHGADLKAKNEGGRTPLHFAAGKHNVEMIELLIAKGADVNAKDDDGMTPVSVAMASRGAGREVVDLLVSKGVDIPALHLAAYQGELRKVQQSLDEHKNVNSRDNTGRTALHYAAGAGQKLVVEFLITRGAEVNAKAENSATPLHCAAGAGWINVAGLLIAKGADVNARDRGSATALHIAAWAGHEDLAELLITKGTDVTAKDRYGYVPLHAAAWTGLAEVSELLIAKGNDPDAKDIWDITPLHHAVENDRNYKVAEILIARGADVNAKNKWDRTPLHCAVWHAWMYGNNVSNVVELLLESSADVNARDNSDWTPLCDTSAYGQKELAELLLAKGAKVNIKTKDGKTPLSLAKDKGYIEIVELLRKHGAEE